GIRDFHVTGVQTCALPIYRRRGRLPAGGQQQRRGQRPCARGGRPHGATAGVASGTVNSTRTAWPGLSRASGSSRRTSTSITGIRSEERRVGKEGRVQSWSG